MATFETKALEYLAAMAGSLTGTAQIRIPAYTSLLGTTGAPLAVFADNAGASAPGVQINSSETFCVRWNNQATQVEVALLIPIPADIDTGFPVTVGFEVFKVGATAGDVTTVTFRAFLTKSGQLATAGVDVGGASTAVTPAATSLTEQTVTRSISSANLVTYLGTGPSTGKLALFYKPTDGTLGTDDFACTEVVITYTRRSLVVAV